MFMYQYAMPLTLSKCKHTGLVNPVCLHSNGVFAYDPSGFVSVLFNESLYFFFTNPERSCEGKRENLHVSSERVRMFQST